MNITASQIIATFSAMEAVPLQGLPENNFSREFEAARLKGESNVLSGERDRERRGRTQQN